MQTSPIAAIVSSERDVSFLLQYMGFPRIPSKLFEEQREMARSTMPSPLRNSQIPDSPSPASAPAPSPSAALILSLPSEILDQILDSLTPPELALTSGTCRRLHKLASRDSRWEAHVSSSVFTQPDSSGPCDDYKSLYASHHAHWFLPQHRLWFSDAYPHGKLLLSRYDPRSGCIEAYALAGKASEGFRFTHVLEWENDVVYRSFNPIVQLDLNQPVVRLNPHESRSGKSRVPSFTPEVPMRIPSSLNSYSDHLTRTFMHTRNLPTHLVDPRTSLWPPLILPSPGNQRTRASTSSNYSATGHKPSRLIEASTTSFRLRQTLNFHPFNPLQPLLSTAQRFTSALPGDRVDTYATLDPRAYTPTLQKPYQGIFVGDYSMHGCEFLLITQPDPHEARPLPSKARKALQRWPNVTPWQALLADVPGEDDDIYDDVAHMPDELDLTHDAIGTTPPAALQLQRQRLQRGENVQDTPIRGTAGERGHTQRSILSEAADDAAIRKDMPPFKGRLEAIKITGDPNVPRGEITFVADDLGEKGLVGYTRERDFFVSKGAAEGRLPAESVSEGKGKAKVPRQDQYHFEQLETEENHPDNRGDCKGTRLVRSVGHICETTRARRESYIPSQLLLISPDRIAQWWMPYRHVSFYERVNWEKFLEI